MVQSAASILPLSDTSISPFLLKVFALGLGLPVAWLLLLTMPSKELQGMSLLPYWLYKGAVFFRGSSFKHSPVLPGVQHI